jgi:hypothetical protein
LRTKICLYGFLSLVLASSLFGADSPAGYIKTTKGTVQIIRQGQTLQPRVGDKVLKDDVFRTGANGSLGMTFKDDALLSLGPDSRVVIKDYAFSPAEGKLSFVARILKGTAVFLSGIITKLAPDSVRLETPHANIGFRGTRVAVQVKGEV